MAQLQLPIFSEGITQLSPDLGVCCRDGRVSYFYGMMPVFSHGAKDIKSFRLFTSQLYLDGKVKQSDIVRVFGVPAISVKRAVKLLQREGPGGFWKKRQGRGAAVLTPSVLKEIQEQLDDGKTLREIAQERNLKLNTLNKAVLAGKLHYKKKERSCIKSPKSQ